MNYLLKSKPEHKYRGNIISIIILFCLLNLFAFLFPNFTRSTFFTISKPLWVIRDVVLRPFSNIKGYFTSKNSLISNNLSLEEEVSNLKLKKIDYDVLSKEFEDLKNQLGRQTDTPHIVSRVLSKPPYSPYDTFIIDVGSSDGVSLGNRVYISDNIIVGLIKNITPHTSLVELFSNGDGEQEATLSRTGASFVLKGLGGANLELEVPKDTDIVWGDVFLYPKFSPSMIGSVYYIDTNSQSSFKKIYIRVPGNVFSTKYVFVEKN
ncbi:MAG: rod shape-determining protein MreC [Candidatus Zambryskibacteria bacterium]|nr:rod shape-determining protein MreC [Candidatus Zambryskibacteria bacterium]